MAPGKSFSKRRMLSTSAPAPAIDRLVVVADAADIRQGFFAHANSFAPRGRRISAKQMIKWRPWLRPSGRKINLPRMASVSANIFPRLGTVWLTPLC